jgi:hypothetical protein
MEISKDDTIFTIIDNISMNGEENIENIIKVEGANLWSEDNYYNLVNIMKTEGYERGRQHTTRARPFQV